MNFLVDLVFFHFLDINPHSHTNNLSLNTVAKLVSKQWSAQQRYTVKSGLV